MDILFDLFVNFFESKNNIVAIVSLIVALIIGTAVSFDVYGLIRSQYREYRPRTNPKLPAKVPEDQADLHASWHAGLFLGYMIAVNAVVSLVSWVISLAPNFIKEIVQRILNLFSDIDLPEFDENALRASTLLIFGMLIILLVWQTYSGKIVEDHREKLLNPENPLKNQRADIKFIFGIIRNRLPNLDRRLDHAVALTVAVDMLAISALIRVYFEGVADTGMGRHINFIPWFRLSELLTFTVNVSIFSIVIYNVVYTWALRAARKAQRPQAESSSNTLIFLRILEPLIVFIVLFAALPHLIGSPESKAGSPYFLREIALWGLFGAAATLLLVVRHRCRTIRAAVTDGVGIESKITERFIAQSNSAPSLAKRTMFPVFALAYAVQAVAGAFSQRKPLVRNRKRRFLRAVAKALSHHFVFVTFTLIASVIFAWNHTVGSSAPLLSFMGNFAILTAIWAFLLAFLPKIAPSAAKGIDRTLAIESDKGIESFFRGAYFSLSVYLLCLIDAQIRYVLLDGESLFSLEPHLISVALPWLYLFLATVFAHLTFQIKLVKTNLTLADFRVGFGLASAFLVLLKWRLG